MNIWQIFKKLIIYFCVQSLILTPVMALDFESTVNDSSRVQYVKPQKATQTTKSTVPALPQKANSSTVAPVNNSYTGKSAGKDAFTPCTNVNTSAVTTNKPQVSKTTQTTAKTAKTTKTTTTTKTTRQTQRVRYRTAKLSKGTQFRVSNCAKVSDYMYRCQKATFVTIHRFSTPYYTIPENTKFTAKVVDAHRPQMTCNGGLVALQFVYADINGVRYPINAKIVKVKTNDVHFGNMKGKHTYFKSVGHSARWGHKICKKWTRCASKLTSKGPCIILAPFPYIGGVCLACVSTLTSPVTALFCKGGSISFPAGTIFTIELTEDVNIRY